MKKKWLSLLLALLLLVLPSCRDGVPESPEASGSGEADSDEIPGTQEQQIPVSDLSKYYIVYPENASTDLVGIAQSLSTAIKSMFGVLVPVKSDYYNDFSTTYRIGEYEILLGSTNRPESAQLKSTLLYRDYGYTMVGKKLVICGADDEMLDQAVAKFTLAHVFSAKPDAEIFFSSSASAVVSGSYRHQELRLNGIPVEQYRLVYPRTGSELERQLADILWLAVAVDCGVELSIVSDDTAYNGEYEIQIGKTNRFSSSGTPEDLHGMIESDGNAVLLWGNGASGNLAAVKALINTLESSEACEVLDIVPDGEIVALVRENGAIRTMSFNLLISDVTDIRMRRVRDTILQYLPDTVGLQEADAKWMEYLKTELGAYYQMVGDDCPGVEGVEIGYTPILFAKDRFELIESNTYWLTDTPEIPSKLPDSVYYRLYTYVILKNKSDETQWLHLNTHFDFDVDVQVQTSLYILQFLSAHKDMACVLTGDLNMISTSPGYQTLSSGRLKSSVMLAETTVFGTESASMAIDHALVSDDFIDVLHHEVAYRKILGGYASDHRAIWIDFIIDYNGTGTLPQPDQGSISLGVDEEGGEYLPPIFFH